MSQVGSAPTDGLHDTIHVLPQAHHSAQQETEAGVGVTGDAPPQAPARKSHFQCGTCQQAFTRLDHLARHVRSHTKEKPYACTLCSKRFGRVDLLRRHSALHGANADIRREPSVGTAAELPLSNKRLKTAKRTASVTRVSRACDACAEDHLKCEDSKPCTRCRQRDLECRVSAKAPNDDTSVTHERAPGLLSPHRTAALVCGDSTVQVAPSVSAPNMPDPFPAALHIWPEGGTDDVLADGPNTLRPPSAAVPEYATFGGADCFNFGARPYDTAPPSGIRTPRGLTDFGLETDLDFSLLDLSFLDTYSSKVPFKFGAASQPPSLSAQDASADLVSPTTDNPIGGPQSKSIWRFIPATKDHGFAEQENLSLPVRLETCDTPESLVGLERRATTERLDLKARDKILAIVLSQMRPHLSPALSAFPSLELLDSLIQYFLTVSFSGAIAWIRSGRFRPNEASAELLLAMAAAGAVLAPDPSLQKLGFAIQEVIRNHLPTIFEADNTKILDLQLQQTFMLHLEIGLWSGNSRKIEISESFQQPLLTMLRRRGRFSRSTYLDVTVQAEDQGHVLDAKWQKWIEQETCKRLVYRLLQYDAQCSMALCKNPLISYAEMALPLPAPQEIWTATSASEWKIVYLAHAPTGSYCIPSLTECLCNLDHLETYAGVVDATASRAALLHVLWGLVWEYRQSSTLFRTRPSLWDSQLIMTSRYQELCKILDYFRLSMTYDNNLLLEVVMMHLHLSLDEIHLFTGLDSSDEAQCVPPSIVEWAGSQRSRRAVWHAGQVVRAARALPAMHLRDFNAVALYHAGLAFWAYGRTLPITKPDINCGSDANIVTDAPTIQPQQIVFLDLEENAATKKFLALGRGVPALRDQTSAKPHVLLKEVPNVLRVIASIMKGTDTQPTMQTSPLVDNLIQLIKRLQNEQH
ncbi:hypothetical protein BAUCODRAFT_30870 [Baudoinia panamericana UAMH 10762]|uniref:C6 transcription factor RegA n=1 Tax=Baudoinia panamericana (strain UAMH 10762) TaxID=717646 RepID=M2MPE3_BAUPA|nr:uncharacterized protein BAUCODRAFT_30870 [Baudoinia panamericana UAMH 10762]EMC98601.1 hypothetical protein BAUCODRAFT_30870 [Baudoinia panamericana UAMH 10762]